MEFGARVRVEEGEERTRVHFEELVLVGFETRVWGEVSGVARMPRYMGGVVEG